MIYVDDPSDAADGGNYLVCGTTVERIIALADIVPLSKFMQFNVFEGEDISKPKKTITLPMDNVSYAKTYWNGLYTYIVFSDNRGSTGRVVADMTMSALSLMAYAYNTQLTVTATGTGAGVSTLVLAASEDTTLFLGGNANFYTDAEGTLGATSTFTVVTGADRTIYLKCTAGTAYLNIQKNKLTKINIASAVNSPSIGEDISRLTALTYLSVGGNNTLSGSVAGLTTLTYLAVTGDNTLTGSIAALTALTSLSVFGNNTLTGSVTALPSLTLLEVAGYNTISGSIAALVGLEYMSAWGSNTLTGSIASLTGLIFLQGYGNNTLTFPNVTNITGLCSLYVHTSVTLTSTNVNQLLADFWLNRNAAKPSAIRVINIAGSITSGAPTGQGLTDKAALAAYSSPTPPATAALWTCTTR